MVPPTRGQIYQDRKQNGGCQGLGESGVGRQVLFNGNKAPVAEGEEVLDTDGDCATW